MTVNLEMTGGATGSAGTRPNRLHAEARQDRWLCELEKAALSIGIKKGEPMHEQTAPAQRKRMTQREATEDNVSHDAAAVPLPQQAYVAPLAAPQADVVADLHAMPSTPSLASTPAPSLVSPAAFAVAPTNPPPLQGVVAGGIAVAESTATPPMPAPTPGRALAAAPAPGKPVAAATEDDNMPGAADPVHAGAAATAVESPLPNQAASMVALVQQAGPAAQLFASNAAAASLGQAGQPAALAAVNAADSDTTQPAVGKLKVSPFILHGEAGEAGMADLATTEEAAPEAASAPAFDGDLYAKQQLHLFHGDGGVHAYVRDAALDAVQAVSLLQTMSIELGAAGTRLNGLTVNGRRVGANAFAQPGSDTDGMLDGAGDVLRDNDRAGPAQDNLQQGVN